MPANGKDTNEVMIMKKLLGGIKKNIFYISLITGMAVLVTVVGLYNAKNNSKEKNKIADQSVLTESVAEMPENDAEETISGKDRKDSISTEEKIDQSDVGDGDITDTDTEKEVETEETEETSAPLHFDAKQGIEWPLAGNVIIPYSMDTTVYFETLKEYKCSPAMVIEAQTGDEIKAVAECTVSEVSSSPELGNYVKLDLGDGYIVTLGQFQDVKVALGTHLRKGQTVGTVGEPSRFYSQEGTNLYFAVEKDSEPVDPMLLLQ